MCVYTYTYNGDSGYDPYQQSRRGLNVSKLERMVLRCSMASRTCRGSGVDRDGFLGSSASFITRFSTGACWIVWHTSRTYYVN